MGSPFASLTVSAPIPLPFDQGQWVTVRALTGRQHEEAQDAHRVGFIAGDKWAGFFRAVSGDGPSSEAVQRLLRDPLTGYDRYALVRSGLVAWSYEQPITDGIDDLNDDAIDFIAREVLKRTKPGLFLSGDEQEHARKNDSGSSTEA